MQREVSSAVIYRFGVFEANITQNVLMRAGVRVKIQEQPFRVLEILLENAGETVTRDALRQQLWPDGTFVDFDGSLNVILKKLRAALGDDSENPLFIETIPRQGYRFIAPVSCSAANAVPSPVQRAAPAAPPVTGVAQPPDEGHKGPWRSIYAYLAVAALLLVGGGVWFGIHSTRLSNARHNAPTPSSQPTIRRSVAVLSFDNLGARSDDAWMGTALAEMLNTELAGGGNLRLVPGEDIAHLRLTSPWPASGTLDQSTTARIASALNTDLLVAGSYTTLGSAERRLRLDVRLQDAKTGEILTEIAESGRTDDLFQIVARAGAKLRNTLGVPPLDESDQVGVLAVLPRDPIAAKLYSLGITKLRQFDALAAKDLLEQTTRAEPKFALGHAMLARAWSYLGYEQNRREEARKALDLSAGLPQPEQLLIEGDYYESLGNHGKASSVYRALFALFPDNVEYGLQLASAQLMDGHGSEALATIAQLRSLPPPASDDPNIDLMAARIARVKADSLRLIRSALAKASAQGRRLVYAKARHDECITVIYGENPQQEGTASCEEAYKTFLAAGNRLAAADCVRLIADRQGGQGRYDEAVATYQRALDLLRELGDLEKTGAVLNNMGEALMAEGKLDSAELLFRQAKAKFRDAGDRDNAAVAVGNLGDVLFARAQLSAAAEIYMQGLQIVAGLDPSDPSYFLMRLADLNLVRGDAKQAAHLIEEAFKSIPGEAGEALSSALATRGDVLLAEGDLAGAREQYRRSLEIRQRLNARLLAGEAEQGLAVVAMEEGHAKEAEDQLRQAMSLVDGASTGPAISRGNMLLSKALWLQGKLPEADQAIRRASENVRSTPDVSTQLALQIQSARIRLAAAPSEAAASAALQQLRDAVSRAQKLGYYTLESEARIALATVELKSNPQAAHQHLESLAKEARGHGLELLARHADQAANPVVAGAQMPATR